MSDVVFFIEHVDRELDVILEIAERLAAGGLRSRILSVFFHGHQLLRAPVPLAVVVPYVTGESGWPARLATELYGKSVPIVNMNWEQVLMPANQHYKRPRDDFSRFGVYHVAWDPAFHRFLSGHAVPDDRIGICGQPAEELFRQQLSLGPEIRRELAASLTLPSDVPWLFFPTNYSWAFTTDFLVRTRIQAGYDEATAWAYRDFARASHTIFATWLCATAQAQQDRLFIVRPHPSVSEEQYRDRFMDVHGGVPDNVVVTKAGNVRQWLPAVDAVFTSWSTVGLDAHRAGIPAYLIAPFEWPSWLFMEWLEALPNLLTESDFSAATAAVTRMTRQADAGTSGSLDAHASFIAAVIKQAPARRTFRPSHLRAWTWLKLLKCAVYSAAYSRSLGSRINHELTYDYFGQRTVEPSSKSKPKRTAAA